MLVAVAVYLASLTGNAADGSGGWRISYGEDRITGKKAWLATSPNARAENHIGEPLQGPDSWVGFYCHQGGEGAFLGFSQAPKLPQGHGRASTRFWPVRTRWDDEVRATTLHRNADTTILEFGNPGTAVRLLNGSNSALVELPWEGPALAYFVYAVAGARNAIQKVRGECGSSGPRVEGSVEELPVPAALALEAAFTHQRASRQNARLSLQPSERSRRALLAREEERLEHERRAILAKALDEYMGALVSAVARNWRRPTGVPPGLRCTVSVVQANNGKVLRVEITQSSGNVAFDRSVEQAVLAASPLPAPRQRAVFEREIVFLFNPRS